MRIRKNITGSVVSQTLFFRDEEIERMCVEALSKSGFMPSTPQPIDIESFVESHFSCSLDFATEIDNGVLGWTLFGKGAFASI
jgi:hypothetical protein